MIPGKMAMEQVRLLFGNPLPEPQKITQKRGGLKVFGEVQVEVAVEAPFLRDVCKVRRGPFR